VKKLTVYIAASWKHQLAVEMLTAVLRERGHEVRSFVENNHGEQKGHEAKHDGKPVPFEEWVWSPRGRKSFEYDTRGAAESNLVVYIGPSGMDAAAEVGVAWARGVRVLGLWAKGEGFGLMRRMIEWSSSYQELLRAIDIHSDIELEAEVAPPRLPDIRGPLI
jgi:hypothetical protein